MLKRILSLIKKELIATLVDKRSRFILIIPPIIQLFVFSLAATLDVKNISMGIFNEDQGSASIEIQQRFSGSPSFSKIHFYKTLQEAEHDLVMQKILCILHFGQTFSKDLISKNDASVQMILDGRKSNSTQIILGYANKIISQYSLEYRKKNGLGPIPSIIIQRNWFNPNLIYQWFTVPGLVAILAMTTSLTVTSLSIAREKELGTFEQLLVSPMTPLEILIGKAIPGFIIGTFEATIILLAGVFVFNIPFSGSLFAFYFALLIFITSIVGIGLFLSSISQTQQQALLNIFFFISPAIILSGFATPIANMPELLQMTTIVNPLKYFLIISRGAFLKEMSAHDILQASKPMVWIALFTLTAAGFSFRKRTG